MALPAVYSVPVWIDINPYKLTYMITQIVHQCQSDHAWASASLSYWMPKSDVIFRLSASEIECDRS